MLIPLAVAAIALSTLVAPGESHVPPGGRQGMPSFAGAAGPSLSGSEGQPALAAMPGVAGGNGAGPGPAQGGPMRPPSVPDVTGGGVIGSIPAPSPSTGTVPEPPLYGLMLAVLGVLAWRSHG